MFAHPWPRRRASRLVASSARLTFGATPRLSQRRSPPRPMVCSMWLEYGVAGDPEVGERVRREPVALSEQPQQHVLGPEIVVAQRARLLLRDEEDRLHGAAHVGRPGPAVGRRAREALLGGLAGDVEHRPDLGPRVLRVARVCHEAVEGFLARPADFVGNVDGRAQTVQRLRGASTAPRGRHQSLHFTEFRHLSICN